MPASFDDMKWVCPALLVDYVRVYEKVDHQNGTHMHHCSINHTEESLQETEIKNNTCLTTIAGYKSEIRFTLLSFTYRK